MEIKDAVAVVTGGASGLGLATTKALLDEGAKVVILDLPTSKGEDVAKDLNAEAGGDRVAFAAADVTDEEAVTKAFDLAETLGPVRIVVNCAGTGDAIRVLGKAGVYPLNKFARIVNIKLVGTFNVLRASYEFLRKPGASLISITAGQATRASMFQAHVCAAKAGINMLTQCLALEWGPAGVRVNAISPGPIEDTEGMLRLAPTPEAEARIKARVPAPSPGLTVRDPAALLAREPDVLIDALSDPSTGLALTRAALARGVHVVTANKQAVVEDLFPLARQAHRAGVSLRISACFSVSGSVTFSP